MPTLITPLYTQTDARPSGHEEVNAELCPTDEKRKVHRHEKPSKRTGQEETSKKPKKRHKGAQEDRSSRARRTAPQPSRPPPGGRKRSGRADYDSSDDDGDVRVLPEVCTCSPPSSLPPPLRAGSPSLRHAARRAVSTGVQRQGPGLHLRSYALAPRNPLCTLFFSPLDCLPLPINVQLGNVFISLFNGKLCFEPVCPQVRGRP